MLPDLGVAPIPTPLIERTSTGEQRLRFTVSIANVGKGSMVAAGARPALGTSFVTWQQIQRADGSVYRVKTPGVHMVFVGSTDHGHWHVHGAARYELRRLGEDRPLRIRLKRGFCLYDSTPYELSLPGAPKKAKYPRDACGKKRDLKFAMGVSVGWKDDYYWRILGQEMDITELPKGKYRLLAKADPRNWWRESDELNNVTWVDIEIDDTLIVKVLRRSPRL